MRKAAIFLGLSLVLLLGASPALAQGIPKLPHAFFGTVTVNGALAADGTQVSATANIGEIISTQNPVTTVGGKYGIGSPYLLVQGYNIPDNATITFHVTNANGTAIGGTDTFVAGGGPTQKNLSVTIVTPTPRGWGGGAPAPAVTTVSLTGLTATLPLQVNVQGIVQISTAVTAADGKLSLDIPAGTKILDAQGNPLSSFTAVLAPSPPAPPPQAAIILAHNLGPDGATFAPPITLTIIYDPGALPAGVAEDNLSIAYWNGTSWVVLETTVNTTANTISCQVSHFTVFAIIGAVTPPPPPVPPAVALAAFSLADLTVSPREIQSGELVTIGVTVANTGGTQGSYTVVLKLNGVKEAEKSVTIAAGGSGIVTFSVSKEEAGSYSVTVDGLSASLTVLAPPPLPPPLVPEVPAKPTNWPLIGGIIAGVVIVGLLIFFLVRRRRAY